MAPSKEPIMAKPCVWIVGDWQAAIFGDALEWLALHSNVVIVDDIALSAKLPGPAVIVLVQSRPGQISQHEVECLHAVAPLARLIALVGSWCEGEMRSGRPWPGIVRVPWRQWRERLPKELGCGAGSMEQQSRLPRICTENDRIEQSSKCVAQRAKNKQFALVHTDSRINFESIAAALSIAGIAATWALDDDDVTTEQHIDFLVYDGWEQIRHNEPISLSSRERTAAILLLHFPRPEDFERAASAGISRIVAQPLILHDLIAAIEPDFASV